MATVMAVAMAVDPWGFRPFTTLRWAVLGVTVAVACYGTQWRVPRRLAAAWLVLLAALALAAILSDDRLSAFLGHPRRNLGLIGWGICALAFLVGTGLDRISLQARLARGTCLAALLTGVAAIADRLGWDPMGVEFADDRVGGLLGQPIYLAAFVVLVLPICVAVAVDPAETRWWHRTAAVATGVAGVTLWASGTRGAWLATLAAGLAAVVAHEGLRSWLVRRRRPVLAVTAVAAVVAVAGPLGALFDRSAQGGLGRVDDWRVAARVIADHPLVGVGPEGYRIAAPEHIDADYTARHGRDEVVDRAHSNVLDVAATGGVVAAGAYVTLLVGVGIACTRVLRRRAGPLLVGAAVGVLAWMAQQAVSFPLAEVDPAGWLWAGVVVMAASTVPGTESATTGRRGQARWSRPLCLGLAAVFALAGMRAVAADRELDRAEDDIHRSRVDALRAADRATRVRPEDVDAWYLAAQVAASGEDLLSVDAGLDRVERGLEWVPHDPALRTLHEQLLVERALRSGLREDLDRARRAAEEMVRLDPTHPTHRRLLGLVLRTGQDEALEG